MQKRVKIPACAYRVDTFLLAAFVFIAHISKAIVMLNLFQHLSRH